MKYFKYVFLVVILVLMTTHCLKPFAPMGKTFGMGLMIGEPTGLTAKIWTQNDRAFALSLGNSYIGKIRIGADYLWHFNAFNSSIVNLYAGPGIAVGIGESGGVWYQNKNKSWYKDDDEIGLGVRGIFGMNIVPKKSPLEFFLEMGLMVGVMPSMHTNFEAALGFRFYF